MRRLGKCDGCRQRKVKCDEKKPSCGGCQKGSRPCNYSYPQGQGFALVMQNPSQMTRYGRSMATLTIYPLSSSQARDESSTPDSVPVFSPDPAIARTPDPSDLHLRGGMVAADGRGVFQTLAPVKVKARKPSKKVESYQRRRCQAHLLRLQQEASLVSHRPSSPDTRLIAMFIGLLRPDSTNYQHLFTLGDWVKSIPSRIGSSPVVTMAAEFFIQSFDVYRDKTHSNQALALRTKSKALKELQLSVVATQQHPTYDLVIATKLHYAAEVLLGVDNMHYAIHTLGLTDLLKSGLVSGADEGNFWNIIDNTYIDDITIAMTAGRLSVYDNDFYLSSTHPAALTSSTLTTVQRTTRAMMHILIHLPRLILTIRHALQSPGDVVVLASAISIAENLWLLTEQSHFAGFIEASIATVDEPIEDAVADILLHGVRFDTAQNMVICTRYWLLQVLLSGTIDTLYRRFPHACALSLLPDPETLHRVDTNAAAQLGRVVLGLDADPSPLTLVRTHGPLSGSIGAWHRQIRYLSSRLSFSDDSTTDHSQQINDLLAAERMKRWLLARCNVILKRLNISRVDERAWLEALDCMAGEELVDWIPSKVSFGSEDGEIVMKLEYSDRTANGDPRSMGGTTRVFNVQNPAKFGPQHLREWVKGNGGPASQ
ncbi:hypothetical protein BU25DRAFT_411903 [Macroventuria anomochaeta]|uniref:Uncharacterized protein n=1 Tax=Macroventuria anomochaeta TaxID=301207 RepID=A0ACB6RVS4_9PLEO|nr:uncharacterized protein BU25DRAFT_411903 [Macroventuria anomochaeta]KAF2626070.1 hypothetical protein BU25DRAFT_411903 [Macroventuria anomochaeta]